MDNETAKIRKKAQGLFNGGRNADGKKGSKMPVFSAVYNLTIS